MKYKEYNFIDFTNLINDNLIIIDNTLNEYDLLLDNIDNKDVRSLISHSLIKILFNEMLTQDRVRTIVYVNTNLPEISSRYDLLKFKEYYNDFIDNILLKLKMRIIKYNLCLLDFVTNINTDPLVHEAFVYSLSKQNTKSKNIINFFNSKGLHSLSKWFNSSPKLKMLLLV